MSFLSWPSDLCANFALDSSESSDLFYTFPTDIQQRILRDVPLPSILALSSTSRSLRNLLADPPYLKQVLKQAIINGVMQWILPVDTMSGEVQSAFV